MLSTQWHNSHGRRDQSFRFIINTYLSSRLTVFHVHNVHTGDHLHIVIRISLYVSSIHGIFSKQIVNGTLFFPFPSVVKMLEFYDPPNAEETRWLVFSNKSFTKESTFNFGGTTMLVSALSSLELDIYKYYGIFKSHAKKNCDT